MTHPPAPADHQQYIWQLFNQRALAAGIPTVPPPTASSILAPQPPTNGDLSEIYQQLLSSATRRAGGVYYTPPAIADYIVAATLRPLIAASLAAADPLAAVLALRVVDLSCGSGRMLAAAVRLLGSTLAALDAAGRSVGEWRCAALGCVYGCDADPLAVEVARYCLWLEFVPSGSAELPPLQLIVGDGLAALPRGWSGFDAVVGNPPYVANRALIPAVRARLRDEYGTARGQFDLCVPFVEAGLRALRAGGVLGYILSNKFMAADYGAALRELLVEHSTLLELRDVSADGIFAGAAIYPTILIAQKAPPVPDHLVRLSDPANPDGEFVQQRRFAAHPTRIIAASGGGLAATVAAMQAAAAPLGRQAIRCGIAASGFASRARTAAAAQQQGGEHMPLLGSRHAGEYRLNIDDEPLLIDRHEAGARRWADFARPKVLIPGIAARLRASYDPGGHALGRVYYITDLDPYLLLALLNSELLDAYYHHYYWPAHLSGGYLRINSTYLATLPLRFTPSAVTAALASACAELIASGAPATAIRRALEPQVRQLYGLQ